MVRKIHMDTIRDNTRTRQMAVKLGISLEDAADHLAEAHAKLGIRVIPASDQRIAIKRFKDGKLTSVNYSESGFPATMMP